MESMNFLVKTMMVLACLAGMVGAEVPSLGLSALSPMGGGGGGRAADECAGRREREQLPRR